MVLIRDLLARDLSHPIEEIVKVSQVDEQAVATEIAEYVVTDRISEQYRTLLTAMADAPAVLPSGRKTAMTKKKTALSARAVNTKARPRKLGPRRTRSDEPRRNQQSLLPPRSRSYPTTSASATGLKLSRSCDGS